eukprot:GHVR01171690.1.p1 GENE.GHVR01171690.1~~GHVR01171690.1.p1  ORF type:complete len:216 (+),score=47.97 GHVR01171690.1:34-681(+)
MVEEGVAYTLITSEGETLTTSRNFSGSGKATYRNGDTYEGEYLDGVKHGKGKYTYANGDIFEGPYWKNQRIGLGRLSFAKGGFYHGNFSEGKRHGEGTEKYLNDDVYSGQWNRGFKHGKGTYAYAVTRFKYVGEWERGHMMRGRWLWKNGTQYVGTFKDNQPYGKGLWLFPSSTQVAGVYDYDVIPLDAIEQLNNTTQTQKFVSKWKTESVFVSS